MKKATKIKLIILLLLVNFILVGSAMLELVSANLGNPLGLLSIFVPILAIFYDSIIVKEIKKGGNHRFLQYLRVINIIIGILPIVAILIGVFAFI
jgi:hypothetical protein